MRTACPLYGFNGMFGVFMDSRGNQCALITKSYSPCQMEMAGKAPDWAKCPLNTEENRKSLVGALDLKVFPKELWPKGESSWDGISLKSWMKYITEGVPITD